MSCKWGSDIIFTGQDQHISVELDSKAKFVEEVAEWKQATLSSSMSNSTSLLSVPPESLELVTTGEVRAAFNDSYAATIGASFKVNAKIDLGNGNFAKAQLWDTAGQERYRTIGRAYYRGADVCIVVYDITSAERIDNIRRWIEEFRSYGNESTCIVLFGNKLDLEDKRKISFEEVKNFAEENQIFFIEISAKTGQNLERAFARLYSEAYMLFWSQSRQFQLSKFVIIGDSGVGKTSIFDRLEGFYVDLTPLVKAYPIDDTERKIKALEQQRQQEKEKSWFSFVEKDDPAVQKKKKSIKLPDTNVISLNLGLLSAWADKCEVATGDPELCTNCNAAFTLYDKIYTKETSYWVCEYCKSSNKIAIEIEEIPRTNMVDYLQRGTPSIASTLADDNSLVVFCIDTSGSMTVTSPIDAKDSKNVKKTGSKKDLPETTAQDAVSQYLPNEKYGIKYISRLEAVQQAIEAQLIDLQQEHPDRGVVLVTFSSDVTIFGDGLHEPRVIAGDRLSIQEYLEDITNWWSNIPKPAPVESSDSTVVLTEEQKIRLANASTNQDLLKILAEAKAAPPPPPAVEVISSAIEINPILKSRSALSTKLFNLTEEGQTALGPGLLVSCAIASIRPGSKVILCTDGIANIGVGSMDMNNQEATREFYKNVAEKALKNNTIISLMGFKGSASNIEVLGEMATKTGGQVDIVDPAEVNKNLKTIFADDSVARDILVNLYLPNGFKMSKSTVELEEWACINNLSGKIYAKKLGSINSDTNLLVPFELNHDYKPPSNIPFQLQIKYTRVEDGKTLLRICSRILPTCPDLAEVDKRADLEVMGLHAVRLTAQTAQKGNYTSARLENYAFLHLMKRLVAVAKDKEEANEILKKYISHNSKFERQMYLELSKEIAQGKEWDDTGFSAQGPDSGGFTFGTLLSSFTSLFSSPNQGPPPSPIYVAPGQAGMNPLFRDQRENRNDNVSNMLWNMRGQNML